MSLTRLTSLKRPMGLDHHLSYSLFSKE